MMQIQRVCLNVCGCLCVQVCLLYMAAVLPMARGPPPHTPSRPRLDLGAPRRTRTWAFQLTAAAVARVFLSNVWRLAEFSSLHCSNGPTLAAVLQLFGAFIHWFSTSCPVIPKPQIIWSHMLHDRWPVSRIFLSNTFSVLRIPFCLKCGFQT